MRSLILAFLTCALGGSLWGAEQLLTVTPQTLAGWTISGADRNAVAAREALVLPGNAQLSRVVPSGAVILRLVSRRVFSEEPAQWPVIGAGSAALALVQMEGRGRFMLVLNESNVKELPWSVSLDEKGVTVDLVLAYDPLSGVGLIVFQDKVQEFEVPLSTRPVELWLSAGQTAAWPQDLMQVMLLTADPADPSGADAKPVTTAHPSPADRLQAAAGILRARDAAAGDLSPAPTGSATMDKSSTVPTLEIFTPPSVRRTKVKIIEAVRAAVERSQGK